MHYLKNAYCVIFIVHFLLVHSHFTFNNRTIGMVFFAVYKYVLQLTYLNL